MAAEEIVPGIYGLLISHFVSVFFIVDADVTLIDSGPPKKQAIINGALRSIRSDSRLRSIAITHRHVDHIGNLGRLVASSGARVYAHPLEAPIIRGASPNYLSFRGKVAPKALAVLAGAFIPRNAEPASVNHEVSDGEDLAIAGGLLAIYTPGHTLGHVSYLLARKAGNVLFVGDATANYLGRMGTWGFGFSDDPSQVNPSIRKLADLNFEVACFGHGRALRGRANLAFRRMVEKAATAVH
jgi:glyoxylase-like metal-dependent hydrolase (beta-lactamase superfamily II)